MDGRHVARSVQLEKQSIPLLQHESEPKGCMGSLRSSWSAIFLELRGPQRLWTTLLAALLTSISPLLGGYTLGFASPALLELNDAKVPDKYHLKGLSLAMFAGLAPVGAAVGGLAAGYAVNHVGRKSALMVSAVLNLIGWLLLMSASFWSDPAGLVAFLLIGRFFTGGALGWGMLCAPLYIGEISPPGLRGIFGSLPQLALTFGVLIVYLLGAIPGFSYQYISLVAVAITAVFVLLVAPPWVPMTPRYLIMNGRWEEALRELKWLRGPNVKIIEEAEDTKRVVTGTVKLTLRELWSELMKQKSIISFFLMIFVMGFQQLSGINALVFFAGNIFKSAGFDNAQFIASITIGVVSTAMTILSVFFVDLFGRKVLLFISGSLMTVCCFGLGTYFFMTINCVAVNSTSALVQATATSCNNDNLQSMVIAFIVLYTLGFSVGWGSVPFILISELLPLRIRGFLAGIAALVNWGCSALVSGSYNQFAELVQPYGAWWTFGTINLLSTVCIAVFLPETKGKKLEDLENMLQKRYRLCLWKEN